MDNRLEDLACQVVARCGVHTQKPELRVLLGSMRLRRSKVQHPHALLRRQVKQQFPQREPRGLLAQDDSSTQKILV